MKKYFAKITSYKIGILIPLLCLMFPLAAGASSLRNLTEKELVDLADVIVVGQVDKKDPRWVGRHIETTYGIRTKEYWKGDLGDSFEFTQMGGEVQRPLPITMLANGAPTFFEGEQVVLFLEKPKKNPEGKGASKLPPESKLLNSYKVVGWVQGKYTIIKNPDTNQEKIVRLGMEDAKVLDTREMNMRFEAAKAYAGTSSQKKEKPVKDLQNQGSTGLSSKARNKKWETSSSSTSVKKETTKDTKEVSLDQKSLAILNLPQKENLDVFKQRIKGYLK